MTTTPIRPPAVCSCGHPARTDNDSGVCHRCPLCGFDEVIPRAATRYTSQTPYSRRTPDA